MPDDDQITDIHELTGKTPDFRTDLAKKLEELVPEAIADGKVDVIKLKELLAEDAGDTNERFGLFWPGKKRAMRAAQDPTTATLKPAPELSKDWDTTQNIFIEGDNLEVLKVLQKQYHNSIKMIYIDPPYNTGKDFVYPDNFQEGLQNYLEFSKQVDEGNKKISTNTETAGRYHSNWLNMMYPRLKLARNLMTDDGVIFISIGDAELDNLKKICGEIFGQDNFQGQIHWRRRHNQPNDPTKLIGLVAEHILVYARSSRALKESGVGKVPLTGKFSNPDNDPRGDWNSKPWKVGAGQNGSVYTIVTPSGTKLEGEWMGDEANYKKLLADDRIIFPNKGEGSPRKKIFEFERLKDGQSATNWFPSDIYGNNQEASASLEKLFDGRKKIFDNPKPVKLLKTMTMLSNLSDGDIVLDFFLGSATTCEAAMEYNAENINSKIKFIGVQLPEPIDPESKEGRSAYKFCAESNLKPTIPTIARERINRAGEKIKADFADKIAKRDMPLDVGYRTYKLADTNFRKWQSSATADLGELQARLDLMRESADDSASESDLLVEVMLKMGLPLTSRTQTRDISGLTVHQVIPEDKEHAEVQPVFYLNEHVKPTLEQLRAIVTELTPSKFVILDDVFQGDNQLKTNLVQTCKSYDVELWTV